MNGTYSAELVTLSLVVAIFSSYTALEITGRLSHHKGLAAWAWLGGGALVMGTGIWSMHFIGMLAFHLPVPVAYAAGPTALSMVLAVLVSGMALYVLRQRELTLRDLLGGSVLLGIGISAMHYTGMAALRMSPAIRHDLVLFAVSVLIAMAAAFAALWIAFRLRDRDFGVALAAKFASATILGLAVCGMHYTGMAAAEFAPGAFCLAGGEGLDLTPRLLALLTGCATLGALLLTLGIAARDAQAAGDAARRADSLQHANRQLSALAHYDPLTGLPNRVLLADRLGQALVRAERERGHFGVMFVDLDGFKPVNDRHGHGVGDGLLRAVAARLGTRLRASDTVARTGGDEFVMVLAHLESAHEAGAIARGLLETLSHPFDVDGHTLQISCSIGISLYPEHGHEVAELEARADEAMYRAKRAGRGTYRYYTGLASAAAA